MQPITNFSIFKNNFKEKDVREKGLNEEEAKKNRRLYIKCKSNH